MRSNLRLVAAVLAVAVLVLPLAVAPVQAGLSLGASSFLASLGNVFDRSGTFERDETLEDFGLVAAPHRPGSSLYGGPLEVIIGLEGNSLATEQARRASLGLSALNGEAQKAYVASLREAQAGLLSSLEQNGATVLYTYQVVYNGIAAVVEGTQLVELLGMPGVSDVHPSQAFTPVLDKSVPFIFGGKTNAELGADGTGVTIAVIDTGIDYTHAGLGGSGNPMDFSLNDPTIIEPGSFPTAKVVGGTDFVGEDYSAGCPAVTPSPGVCSSIPVPDPDPLDQNGHGSHVSGISAGVGTTSVPPGVAPGASLLAVKVFAQGSTSGAIVVAAIEFAVDPNGDGDTSDGADVINMSLGSPFGRGTTPDTVASDAAVDLGVIVVASAGNSGDIPYATGSPAAASKAISVAAGNDPGISVQLLGVSGTDGADGDYEALEAAFTPPLSSIGALSGPAVFVGRACDLDDGSNPFAPGSLADTIPLIERGDCRFDEKILNVEEAGAIAAIVYNNQPGAGPITMGGNPIVSIPGFMIGNVDGLTIRDALVSGSTFDLDPAIQQPIPDRLQGFSSRGPRFVDAALKPDITAPGGAVSSVAMGTGTGAVSFSGTSMSSPHIAGSAALLRELHPDWSVDEVKAVLMNTATDASPNGLPYPVSRMGAGRVQVDVAVDTESVVLPASASFLVQEESHPGLRVFDVELEIRNKGEATKELELSSAFIFPNDDEGSIQIRHADEIKVKAGESKKFMLRLKVDFDLLAPESLFEEYDGFLTLTETTSGGDVLRVPFHIIPIARARADALGDGLNLPRVSTLTFQNRGLRGTLVDIYQFGVADPNEDLIVEGPGAPEDPDDWFDVRHTGAHTFSLGPFPIIEFAMTTHGRRSVANFMETDIFIDVDGGGPDYVVVAADLGAFIGGFPDGRIVSAIFELTSGRGFLQFFVADDMNTAIQTIPFFLDDLNFLGFIFEAPIIDVLDPDFDYFVVTFDFETGSFDVTGTASFNALAPEIDTVPNFLLLAAGSRVTVDVLAAGDGGILALFLNNVAGPDQSQVVDVRL